MDKDRLESYYYRELNSKPLNQMFILLVLFVVNFVAFGFFGIYQGYKAFQEKVVLAKEYEEIIVNLENNISTVEQYEPYVFDNPGVDFINSAVPIDPDYSPFISEVSRIASRNGFLLEGIQYDNLREGQSIPLHVRITGHSNSLPDMIQDLEDMDRIVNILFIDYRTKDSKSEGRILVDIYLEVFRLP